MDFIRETIERALARTREEAELAERYLGGLGLSLPPGPNDEAFLSAPRPHEAALEAHLRQLEDKKLLVLEALMYCGREQSSDIRAMLSHVKSITKDREAAVRTLLEKSPLDQYLSKGLSIVDPRVLESL